jgi:small subunit ribosomal protein S6
MRDYEVVFIINPDLDETAFKELTERVSSWITDAGGTVSKVDFWGKRQLAYPIGKKTEGQYVLIESNMAPSFCLELERNLRLTEPIMRFLIANKE